jgi:hypothetical protein
MSVSAGRVFSCTSLSKGVAAVLGLAVIACVLLCPRPVKCEPSPDPVGLLKRSIKAMERQDSLLADYRYMKTVVMEHLNRDLEVKKKEERLVEVTSVPRGPDVEVLVAVDGKPVSEEERKKREDEQRQGRSGGTARPSLSAEDLISQFDWTFAGTERVDGRPATVLCFRPKAGAVYRGKDSNTEKLIKKVCGRVWVDDEESVITRIEFESTGQVKSAAGLFWTVRSFSVREERTRLEDGVWIDSNGEYFIDATALLVKSIVRRSKTHTHDYEKPRRSVTQ